MNDLQAWTAALDEFERRIEGYEAVLDAENTPPEGLWPPRDIVDRALPPELADRVRQLLKRSRLVEGKLAARRSQLPQPVRAHAKYRRPPASSSFSQVL